MSNTRTLTLVTVALFVTACSWVPVDAGADIEPGYDFARYASYVWAAQDEGTVGDAHLDDNPLLAQRLHDAIHWELAARGIEYGGRAPALAVHYHATVRSREEVVESGRTQGYPTEYGAASEVVEFREGTFRVDIADGATRAIIWSGWARLDLGYGMDPSIMRENIDESIRSMFASFPVPYREISFPEGR